jgi:hypothetical protein
MNFSPVTSSMDTQEILGLLLGVGIPVFVIILMFLVFRKPFKALWNPERKYILDQVKPEQATILSVGHAREGSTTTINGRVYLKIELEVQDPAAPYITSVEALLSDSESAFLFVGRVIPIKVHPENYLKIAVDWSSISLN